MEKTSLLFAALLLFLNNPIASLSMTNLTTDQSALLAFKLHITSDPENILADNWTTTTSVCNWIGVSCGVLHRRVTALNLSDMGLTATLPPQLGNLSFLSLFDLNFNNFHGQVPQELAHLQRLKKMDFGHNNFSGGVPSWLGSLPELQYLLLDNNNFTGIIPPFLFNNSELEQLRLSYNSIQGNIPQGIGNLSHLVSLDLKYNQITGYFPFAIFDISSLQTVDLTSNSLYGSFPVDMCDHVPKLEEGLYVSLNQLYGKIPSSIYKCRNLQYLSLSFNDFNGSIPREIGNLTMLKELYIGYNEFNGVIPSEMGNLVNLEILSAKSGSFTGSIPSFIFNISSLRKIDFANNRLSGSLPADIQYDLPLLEELDLTSNQLSGQFPPGLWECRWLRMLSLSANNFTGSISKNIGNLTSLREMYIGFNNLTGALPKEIGNLNLEILSIQVASLTGSIPFEIFNMSTLRIIALGGNQLSGHLPLTLGLWLPNLEKLYLGDNKLSGVIKSSISNASKLTIIEMSLNAFSGFIPNNLGNLRFLRRFLVRENNLTRESSSLELSFFTSLAHCRHLEMLEISLNQFHGILPASLGNLSTSLQVLNAFGCNLMGNIPSGIGNLSSLEEVGLDSNELTGFIPPTLGKLESLESLYLEHNSLGGSIPNDLCQCIKLGDMYLSGNQLTGFIPPTLGKLESLERLYLEHNSLGGSIPNDLCQCIKLGDIYLSGNQLYGPIPSCLGEHKPLRSLYLDSNYLSSTIPLTLWSLTDLIGLNLSMNSLSGYMSLDIGKFKVISQLDLSWNQLSGDIPSTIGSAQTLVTLSLAHNKLQGPIPESLGNLINLEFLDLSINNLSGGIPKSLEELRYLQFLNLSFNRLKGEIPTGGNLANLTAQSFMQNAGLCGSPRFQVPPCKTKKFQQSRTTLDLLKYILPLVASAILVATLIFVFVRCRTGSKQLPSQVESVVVAWRGFSYQELLEATDAFSESNLLGSGSFGTVYKGTLSDGITIAIKVFNLQAEGAFKSFNAECEVLRNIRHRNLLKIISSCSSIDFKALILEYMPNESLEKWLYSHNYFLDVLQRLNIMIDVAFAMEYLHHGLTMPVVHCDLKPSNVLLDGDMVAHVSDFGIAKLLGEGEFGAQTKTLATFGYMAPEYGMEGIVSTAGDVYSYGVLLMEVFTRKKPTNEMFSGEMSLKHWVTQLLDSGSLLSAVDSNLIQHEDETLDAKEQCVLSVLHLALDCSKDQPKDRIDMKDVVTRLAKVKTVFLAKVSGHLKDQ